MALDLDRTLDRAVASVDNYAADVFKRPNEGFLQNQAAEAKKRIRGVADRVRELKRELVLGDLLHSYVLPTDKPELVLRFRGSNQSPGEGVLKVFGRPEPTQIQPQVALTQANERVIPVLSYGKDFMLMPYLPLTDLGAALLT